MKFIGDDAPNEYDINYYGIQYACQKTRGNFALYKQGEYAARGRVGTSPLYWNQKTKVFSFVPQKGLDEFPPGHLYNFEQDRIVCWDSMYFDKPLPFTSPDAITSVELLIKSAIRFLEPKIDGFLISAGCGSRIIDMHIHEKYPSYTVAYSPGTSFDVDEIEDQNRSVLYFDETTKYPSDLDDDEIPMYVLARHIKNTTNHKKFICGLGCYQLFRDSTDFRPRINHVVDQFAKFGLEVYSPFFDNQLIEYVLDMTAPKDRPYIMSTILGEDCLDDSSSYGQEIHQTVGFRKSSSSGKNFWWYF